MAALRHGISTVIIPKANERDLEEIDQTVRSKLNFVTADSIEIVLKTALNPVESTTLPLLGELSVEPVKHGRKTAIRQ